jgi:23S rRNA pseudouridine1911/1915/1917 synthase
VGLAGRILGEAHIVHRLDEHTSGLLLVARTLAAQTALKALLEVHAVDRRYLAIVAGSAPEGERRVSSVLRRDRGDGLRGSDPEGEEGKPAVTYFQLRERLGPRYSLVEARLETGRTHQVRIHLAEQGLPLLGDPLYAPAGVARLWPRQALHAWSLAFRHPFTRQELRFEAPLADDLEQLRRRILASA